MRSISNFIKGLEILSKYFDDGLEETYFLGAEHDVIYIYVDLEDLPEDSDDGKLLIEYGFHTGEGWEYFT